MNALTPEQIAEICHEANRGYQAAAPVEGIPVALPWPEFNLEHPDQAAGVIAGVEAALAGATPEELHIAWCQEKGAQGWVHGLAKDSDAKTHPCLVPYAELPEEQRLKDRLFRSIVHTVSSTETCPLCWGAPHRPLPTSYSLAIGDIPDRRDGVAGLHPATQAILCHFEYEHLPSELQVVSQPFCDLAYDLALGLKLEGAELTAGLRKLLESKDCAVRAELERKRREDASVGEQ